MDKTGLFKAIASLIPFDEHLATFRGNGYSLKDKNEAKTDKTKHENGMSVKNRSRRHQKKDGIFISQDKYVDEILKKFGFTEVKTTSTPIETQKPLLKDKDGEEVDVHMYRSMIVQCCILHPQDLNIMFIVVGPDRYDTKSIQRSGKAKKSVRLMMEELCKNRQSDLVRKRIERSDLIIIRVGEVGLGRAEKAGGEREMREQNLWLTGEKLMLLGINLLLLVKVNDARHKLTTTGES
ncbi:hypothetical protein Tco_0967088 [Tanacetum coccineum]